MKPSIKPWQGELGVICLPVYAHVPQGHPDWKKIKCPACGQFCWLSNDAKKLIESGYKALCTNCALHGKGERIIL